MQTEISFEFFPPQTPEGVAKLRAVRTRLAAVGPTFFSVTYGAGGSTRELTRDIIMEIAAEGHAAAPHLSCIGSTRAGIRALLDHYRAHGIRRLVALRGDLPSGMADPGEFRHASELVEFIRAETGDWFRIEVAAYPEWHPQAPSPGTDLEFFRRKVAAGADGAITQFFYNPDAYANFVAEARAAGITIPIVPGIMPIGRFSRLARFADTCGAELPRWMRRKFESFGDDETAIRAFGIEVVVALCHRLLELGAPGLHFYTLNQAAPALEIIHRLGLTQPSAG